MELNHQVIDNIFIPRSVGVYKRGRPKTIKSPLAMMRYFTRYVNHTKSTPFRVNDWTGKDATPIVREKEKPLTFEGFNVYLFLNGIKSDVKPYFENERGAYGEYEYICKMIRQIIRQDQIEGGMANMYNPLLTSRLNGLVDKTSIDVKTEQPLFPIEGSKDVKQLNDGQE